MKNQIKKVAVVGTGTLGAQIAVLSNFSGYDVSVFDHQPGAMATTLQKLKDALSGQGLNPCVPLDQWDVCRDQITEHGSIPDCVRDADLVIEAVPEVIALKKEVFAVIGSSTSPSAIIATNSSSMPVSSFEDASGKPERCINLHFYNQVRGMNIVDVMGGSRTDNQVLEICIDWVKSLGCIPLTVKKEILGFCFNRIWRAIKREALYMWGNDYVDYRDIDRAWMRFTDHEDRPGPFGMMDKVGLDVILDIENVYYNESKAEIDRPPSALVDKVNAGELGEKTGQGFYTYPGPEYLEDGFLYRDKAKPEEK